ncbi:hypothetical protein [Streptomyces sp. NPDC002088]|uniref:hypothetical protein n=1 Tax=Streptomyces sp. NPDC002088 TaxID=3154665 RepID=UPI003321ED88
MGRKAVRLNPTIGQTPTSPAGRATPAEKLYGPVTDFVGAQRAVASAAEGTGPLRTEQFVDRLAAWTRRHNTERGPHGEHDGAVAAGGREAVLGPRPPPRRRPSLTLHIARMAAEHATRARR